MAEERVEFAKPANLQEASSLLSELVASVKKRKARDESLAEQRQNFEKWFKEVAEPQLKRAKEEEVNYFSGYEAAELKSPVQKMLYSSPDTFKDREHEVRALQQLNDNLILVSKQTGIPPTKLRLYKELQSEQSDLKKALDTLTAGEGLEWLPTMFSADFIERVEAEKVVAKLHPTITVPLKVSTLKVGGAGAGMTLYKVPESIEDEAAKIPKTDMGTRVVTIDPVKVGLRTLASTELTEDAAYAVMDITRQEAIKAYATGIENAIINGDTAATHQDSDITSDLDAAKLWDGHRKSTLSAAKTDASDTVTTAKIAGVAKAMGKYGKPRELVIVTGMVGYWTLLMLDEVLTIDKYGQKATILTGELASILGIPIIISDQIREDMNASGVYDGVTTTKTILQFVYRNGFYVANKREMKIESERIIDTDQVKLVLTARHDFKAKYDTSTETICGQLYDF